jgi:hypothetical protein
LIVCRMTRVNGGRDGMMMGPVLSGSSLGASSRVVVAPAVIRHAFVRRWWTRRQQYSRGYLLRQAAPADVLRRYSRFRGRGCSSIPGAARAIARSWDS